MAQSDFIQECRQIGFRRYQYHPD